MAKALPLLFLQRLETLSATETEALTGLEDHIETIKELLRETGRSLKREGCIDGDCFFLNWVNELKHLLNDMDCQLDEFIIQMDQHKSERLALTDSFRSDLEHIESRLAEIVLEITVLNSSTVLEEGRNEEDDKEAQSHGKEGQSTARNSTHVEQAMREKDDRKEQSDEKEKGTTGLDSTVLEGEEKESERNKCQKFKVTQGQTSTSSVSIRSKFISLPYYLHPCLMYFCIFPENYWLPKGKLIRLMVAEGLVLEKAGKTMEDVAEEYINELISEGMLQMQNKHPGAGTNFTVFPPCRQYLHETVLAVQTISDSTITPAACRIVTSDMKKVSNRLNNLRLKSLLLFGCQDLSEGNWFNFIWAKCLRVLDLENTRIKALPDQVGDLIFLKYLGLKHTDIIELPLRLHKLQALQTLDIRWCGHLTALSAYVLNLAKLRHLKMFKNMDVRGIRLPEGIGRLRNLLTLTGIYAGANTAGELGELNQIRRLGIMDVADENLTMLYESIMKMQGLLSLSLEAKRPCDRQHLLILESFMPPLLLRKLRLEGRLEKIPSWLGSMENLTKLRLGFSHLSENPMLVLQLLPNLKNLTLWHAYDAKQIGKEFCKAGGFPKLEVFSIASHVLEEWTELEAGALPSLQYLHFHNCLRLRMLPEGLQFVTTLKQLDLLPLLNDHSERLKPDGGEENYKIRHIPTISFLPMSVLSSMCGPSAPPSSPIPNTAHGEMKSEE